MTRDGSSDGRRRLFGRRAEAEPVVGELDSELEAVILSGRSPVSAHREPGTPDAAEPPLVRTAEAPAENWSETRSVPPSADPSVETSPAPTHAQQAVEAQLAAERDARIQDHAAFEAHLVQTAEAHQAELAAEREAREHDRAVHEATLTAERTDREHAGQQHAAALAAAEQERDTARAELTGLAADVEALRSEFDSVRQMLQTALEERDVARRDADEATGELHAARIEAEQLRDELARARAQVTALTPDPVAQERERAGRQRSHASLAALNASLDRLHERTQSRQQ